MDKNVLKNILEKHLKWMEDEIGGERADLRGADLSEADLSGANLCGADLRGADLRGADLYRADLRGADLRGADLHGADLRGADLREADQRGADLSEADLSEADMSGANLCGTKLPSGLVAMFFPLACPESGAFIGWKKCQGNLIVKLQIPEGALRSSAFGRKCRCDKAAVLAIETLDGSKANVDFAVSGHDGNFHYRVGETVSVDNFDTDRTHECAPGIHFFITRQEAVDY